MEDFLVADMMYCTKTIPKTQIFVKTQLNWVERISQPGRLPLRSFTLEPLGAPGAGTGKSCGNEKLRRINYPKEQRNMENTENQENCAYTVYWFSTCWFMVDNLLQMLAAAMTYLIYIYNMSMESVVGNHEHRFHFGSPTSSSRESRVALPAWMSLELILGPPNECLFEVGQSFHQGKMRPS